MSASCQQVGHALYQVPAKESLGRSVIIISVIIRCSRWQTAQYVVHPACTNLTKARPDTASMNALFSKEILGVGLCPGAGWIKKKQTVGSRAAELLASRDLSSFTTVRMEHATDPHRHAIDTWPQYAFVCSCRRECSEHRPTAQPTMNRCYIGFRCPATSGPACCQRLDLRFHLDLMFSMTISACRLGARLVLEPMVRGPNSFQLHSCFDDHKFRGRWTEHPKFNIY